MAERVQTVALAAPARTAVVTDDATHNYAWLESQTTQWAAEVRVLHLPTRSVVAVVGDGEAQLAPTFLGVRRAGHVPWLVDRRLGPRRLDAAVAAVHPAAVIDLANQSIRATGDGAAPSLPVGAGYLAMSSGSQGHPKAIVGNAAGLLHFLDWHVGFTDLGPGSRVGALTSPSFDVVLRDLLAPLTAGAELHMAGGKVRGMPDRVVPWIADNRISLVHAVPSLATRWADAAGGRRTRLQWTLFAGEVLSLPQVGRWRSIAPWSQIVNLYGPAETTLARFAYTVPAADEGYPDGGPLPVGRPLPGTDVDLVGPGGEPAASGRIVLRTREGSLGYLPGTVDAATDLLLRRQDDVTEFWTQDRGRRTPAGDLVVEGRLDSLVKHHGVMVDLAEIETATRESRSAGGVCCVRRESDGELVLFLDGPYGEGTEHALRKALRRAGVVVPAEMQWLTALPLLPGGKVDRQTLARSLA